MLKIGRIKSNARLFARLYSIKVDSFDNTNISVLLDGAKIQLNNVFLRDACTSPESVDQFSKQKLFTTSRIASDLKVDSVSVIQQDNEDALKVKWISRSEPHTSVYPQSFLHKYSSYKSNDFLEEQIYWNNDIINQQNLQADYDDYLAKSFNSTVDNLNKYGLAFINNCPPPTLPEMNEENSAQWPVAKLAEKFGYIKKTFYGTLFDVKNKKQAENIAYTNVFLPLHMDLLYYESPPGLQLLHAIQNSTLGGENIFADSFLAAEHVRETDPVAYDALTKVPVTFHYNNNGEHYYYQRPTIVEVEDYQQPKAAIKHVNYSPPFQGPFEYGVAKYTNNSDHGLVHDDIFADFLRGLEIFEHFIYDPKNQLKVKTPEGTCVIFDNRRVLHSRMDFDDSNGGDRWLMGAYVDGDSFRSKLRVSKRDN